MKNKILICDDEPELRALLVEIAQDVGLEPIEASNGLEALTLSQKHELALVMSDVRMPKMDGLEFLKDFRLQNTKTPFYVLTAYNEISEHQIYLLKGNGILYKPANIDTLTEFFKKYL